MDTKKLIKAIQLIVKEEVKKEVAKKEKSLRESILKEVKQSQPKVVEKDPLDVDHLFETKQETKKSFTNNSTLNELLNETAQGGEWKNINGTGGVFNAQQSTFQTTEGGQVSAQQLQQTEAGQAVVNALTRDYSGLMKHINT